MKVAIRVDASREIGYGHVMRCLALADALGRHGVEVVFMCQQLPGDAQEKIREAGFLCWLLSPVASVEDDADQTAELLDHAPGWDWLIVDHYALSVRWGRGLRYRVNRMMAIDDLANRLLDCDLLLDQNLHANPQSRYFGLVPPSCHCLFGPEYALLRPEFAQFREASVARQGDLTRVLLCFGGADAPDATGRVLEALLPSFPSLQFDVVIGAANPHWERLLRLCVGHTGVVLTRNAEDMALRMAEADLFIGAGGSMTWERAALALPGITISIADNQRLLSQTLADRNEGIDLGSIQTLCTQALIETLQGLVRTPDSVRAMGQKLAMNCDGLGAARVAQCMVKYDDPLASAGG